MDDSFNRIDSDRQPKRRRGSIESQRMVVDRGPLGLSGRVSFANGVVPVRYQHHEMVAGQYFYTCPSNLLSAVVDEIRDDRFDPELLRMERELSGLIGNHANSAGFHDGMRIPFALFGSTSRLPDVNLDDFVGYDKKQVQLEFRTKELERYSEDLNSTYPRAYAGWLVTNRQFLDEQDRLFAEFPNFMWQDDIRNILVVMPGTITEEAVARNGFLSESNAPMAQFMQAFTDWRTRWRLLSLAGPDLPEPFVGDFSGITESIHGMAVDKNSRTIRMPDTMPFPSRDQFRDLVTRVAPKNGPAEHLAEWTSIISTQNTGKSTLVRFARIFELQHYWRIFHLRHAATLQGNLGRLRQAIANHFNVKVRQIELDLSEIGERLGENWQFRTWPA